MSNSPGAKSTFEPSLTIFRDRSEYIDQSGNKTVFEEGAVNKETKEKLSLIKQKLENGYLVEIIKDQKNNPQPLGLSEQCAENIIALVDAVTSEVGRALIVLTVTQMTIKAICPTQSIRLHKGGSGNGTNFSWRKGISMRTLDKAFITPALRKYNLLKLNADGFQMTRSLAENYPYTPLYKAAIRGGKPEWMAIVEDLESGNLNGADGLKFLISILLNRSDEFEEKSAKCISLADKFKAAKRTPREYFELIQNYVKGSDYSARLFEIAIHAAYQSLSELGHIDGYLKPLSQMRSANKKHGNIGDIEILLHKQGMLIDEAWDAKFGKYDLREEIEELADKLQSHPECKLAGFITNNEIDISENMKRRIDEISSFFDCEIRIYSFKQWFDHLLEELEDVAPDLGEKWFQILTECLCQKRRSLAPIDEPCEQWIDDLIAIIL